MTGLGTMLGSAREQAGSYQRIARRFAPYLRGQWSLVMCGALALLAEIALRLAEPWPLKLVFDLVFAAPGKDARPVGVVERTLFAWVEQQPPARVILIAALAIVAVAVLRAASAYVHTVVFALVGNRVLTAVRADLFAHLQRLGLRFHARNRSGDLVTRLVGDVGRLQEVAVTAAAPLVVNTLTFVGMFALMFTIHWELGLLALVVLPIMSLSTARLSGRLKSAAKLQRQREGEVSSTVVEALSSIRLVQALGIEDQQSRVFAKSNNGALKETVRSARLAARLERSVDVLIGVGTALVLWRGATLVVNGRLTPGDLVVFLAYLKTSLKPLRDMAKYTGRIAKAAASGERVMETLDQTPDVLDATNAVPAPAAIDELRFDRVGFAYELAGSGPQEIIHDLSFGVRRGRLLAIVGPSGAGKSTIAALVLRLYDPTRGHVLIDGRDVTRFGVRSLRDRIAPVMQESTLFALSVRENLLLGRAGASDEEIMRACELAGAWEFVQRLPEGLDSVIGERGDTLSGGQKRRLSLARAALRRAPILLLDEPTAGFDQENTRLVRESITKLAQGRITILITHDLETAAMADEVLLLDRGCIAECGTHEALVAAGGRYAAMYRLQRDATRADTSAPLPDASIPDASSPAPERAHAYAG